MARNQHRCARRHRSAGAASAACEVVRAVWWVMVARLAAPPTRLVDSGAKVFVVGRNPDRVRSLAKACGAEALLKEQAEKRKFDAVVHATPLGMFPRTDGCFFSGAIPADLVFDMVYNPLETALLRRASEQGLQTISGLEMFLEQAARQFEIWTGASAPRAVMTRRRRRRPWLQADRQGSLREPIMVPMAEKLTRRQLAAVLSSSAALLAQQATTTPPLPQNPDEELKAVQEQNHQISEQLAQFPLPMTTEPALPLQGVRNRDGIHPGRHLLRYHHGDQPEAQGQGVLRRRADARVLGTPATAGSALQRTRTRASRASLFAPPRTSTAT